MKRFICYRNTPPDGYVERGFANVPTEPQFEGVEFSDGTACIRWLTPNRSHSVWSNMVDLLAVHGHPEYGTHIEWIDE